MSLDDILFAGIPPEQDYITLSGARSPGRATIVGAGSPRRWDIREGYGLSGATVVFKGDGLAKFDVLIDLWEETHWLEWSFFAAVLKKTGAPKLPTAVDVFIPMAVPKSFTIGHPLLNQAPLSINEVVVEDVSQFDQDEEGLWTCRIKFLQYRKPLPALGKPGAAIPSVEAKKPPPAVTQADIELRDLTARVSVLAAGGR